MKNQNRPYVFQAYDDHEDLFVVTARNEKEAEKKFQSYIVSLEMELDPVTTLGRYQILTPEVIQ